MPACRCRRAILAGPAIIVLTWIIALTWIVAPAGIVASAADGPESGEAPLRVRQSLATYLDTFKLGPDPRGLFDAEEGWSVDEQNLSLRLLARLISAPAPASADWRVHAGPLAESLRLPELYRDRLVRVEGKAVFVAPVKLPADQAELHARSSFDLVRIVSDDGVTVDVITDAAPKAWKRWTPIEERSRAIGLAAAGLTAPSAAAPSPTSADVPGNRWPSEPPRLLLVATRVAWFTGTPLGGLGMDYGLFDTVVDGAKLMAADADAFYAMLAAVGRGTQAGIEKACSRITDPIPLIDPRARWMESHRGEGVRLAGVVRRAMRIAVDDPARRVELGTDHYWELYLFLDTPTIQIGDVIQDSFPVVCCVRNLPPEMPYGDPMSEWVEFDGFAMKQYAYSLPGAEQGTKVRRETPLFVGRQVVWKPAPSTKEVTSILGRVFTGLAIVLGIVFLAAAWSMARKSGRRNRDPLPDRVEIE